MKTFLVLTAFLTLNAMAQTTPLTTVVTNSDRTNLLADSFERTLYVFDADQGSNSSKCVGDCAEVWPPYIISAAEAASLQAPFASVARPNRKLQLTFNGRPVYTYMLDRKIGDSLGNGLGGVWHHIVLN
ncbi:MAG: hypothetical protein K0R29_1669 [Pseudobdellovibrio sp.]|jgi:predicted lipoprotein with Yx(FWY)xxD motif|nr:hypothetical protein [Pseudobdellovibrio sp.]